MKTSLILASAVLVIFGEGCQLNEKTDFGDGTGGAGGAPDETTDANTDDADNDDGTGGATTAAGTGGTTPTGGTDGTGGASMTGGTGSGGTTTADGGTGGTMSPPDGGVAAPSVCDGVGTRILTADQVKVDNFEGATLDRGWSTFSDVTTAPDGARMTIQAPGAAGTAHAGHYAGKGALSPAVGGYGVGAVYNMAIDKSRGIYCVDIAAFDGVTFWAKANQPAGATNTNKVSLNFVLPETNAVSVGGDCPNASMNCYHHPRTTLTLTTDWAQYAVPFANAAGGSATVKGRIQELAFLVADPNWDYSLDEIQLYKGTPPTGPVATH